jgi:hypothetical protein
MLLGKISNKNSIILTNRRLKWGLATQFEQCIQLSERRAMKYPSNCHINEIQLRIYLNICD